MSSQNLAKRHDQQLAALIEGKNWKQALSLCEKRIKKGGQIEELLVLKVIILLNHTEGTRRQQGAKELHEILERQPPISEIKALEQLYNVTRTCMKSDPSLDQIWERAVTVRPRDEDIYAVWFHTKFDERNWTAAQKVAMLYMKKFQEKREPFFWNVVTCELAGMHENSSDTDRKILRPLAYGFLSRAIQEVESENRSRASNGSRTIQTLEELLLLLRIYRSQEKYEEAIAVLNSSRVGIVSQVGSYSWELVRHKIEIYAICDRWKDLWQFCQELLTDALPKNIRDSARTPFHMFTTFGDDLKVWVGFITAAIKIGTPDVETLTEALIDSYIYPKTLSRNARLASLKFMAERSIIKNDSPRDEDLQENLFNACFEYFSDYSMKTVCFHDLRPYITSLSRRRQMKFLKHISRHCRSHIPSSQDSDSRVISWLTAEINALKFDYFLLVSRTDIPSQFDLLNAFVCNCLRLFKLSLPLGSMFPPSERRPGDDAAILAVMGLLHIACMGRFRDNSLLRGIVVLEALVAQSRCNYDALLILVRLYMMVGMGSLAMHYYAQLSIKNVQTVTMSWILFTRISTIHPLNPYSTGNETPFDLLKNLSRIIEWGKAADELCMASASSMLNFGQYNTLVNTLANPNFGSFNFPVHMVWAELQRAARFSGIPSWKEFALTKKEMPEHAQDVRDSKPFPDCEAVGQPRFVDYLQSGRAPNDYWLATQLRESRLWGFLHKHHNNLDEDEVDRVIHESQALGRDLGLTRFEAKAEAVTDTLESICLMASRTNTHSPTDDDKERVRVIVLGLIEFLDRWFSTLAAGRQVKTNQLMFVSRTNLAVPSWAYFHGAFLSLDLCRFTLAMINYLEDQKKFLAIFEPDFSSKKLAHLKDNVRKACTAVRQHAIEQRERLQKPDAVQKLLEAILCHPADPEDSIGKELQKMVDKSWLDNTIEKLRTSWVEAINGISDVRVF